MATWYRVGGGPLTTERRVRVVTEDGAEGYVAVVWVDGSPRFFGPVYSEACTHDEDGSVMSARRTVLDDSPTWGD